MKLQLFWTLDIRDMNSQRLLSQQNRQLIQYLFNSAVFYSRRTSLASLFWLLISFLLLISTTANFYRLRIVVKNSDSIFIPRNFTSSLISSTTFDSSSYAKQSALLGSSNLTCGQLINALLWIVKFLKTEESTLVNDDKSTSRRFVHPKKIKNRLLILCSLELSMYSSMNNF